MKKFLLRRIGVASNETIARPSLADCIEIVLAQVDALVGDVLEGLSVALARSGTSRVHQDFSPVTKLGILQLCGNSQAVRTTFEAELRRVIFQGGSQEATEQPLVRFADIQLFDSRAGQLQRWLILRKSFFACVRKISQQAKVQVWVPIREEPHFQRFDQILDTLSAGEHCRDHHQRARFCRNPG